MKSKLGGEWHQFIGFTISMQWIFGTEGSFSLGRCWPRWHQNAARVGRTSLTNCRLTDSTTRRLNWKPARQRATSSGISFKKVTRNSSSSVGRLGSRRQSFCSAYNTSLLRPGELLRIAFRNTSSSPTLLIPFFHCSLLKFREIIQFYVTVNWERLQTLNLEVWQPKGGTFPSLKRECALQNHHSSGVVPI